MAGAEGHGVIGHILCKAAGEMPSAPFVHQFPLVEISTASVGTVERYQGFVV